MLTNRFQLLILLLRDNGVETSVSGNNFLNLAHVDSDYRAIADGFKRSLETLMDNGFFVERVEEPAEQEDAHAPTASAAPAPKAKAARAPQADPAALRDLVLAELRAVASKRD